jgi:hypothetical protein
MDIFITDIVKEHGITKIIIDYKNSIEDYEKKYKIYNHFKINIFTPIQQEFIVEFEKQIKMRNYNESYIPESSFFDLQEIYKQNFNKLLDLKNKYNIKE